MMSTSTPEPADYTITGWFVDERSRARRPTQWTTITLLPTQAPAFGNSSVSFSRGGGPEDMVLAREFSNGRVLYRTDFTVRIWALRNAKADDYTGCAIEISSMKMATSVSMWLRFKLAVAEGLFYSIVRVLESIRAYLSR